MSKLKGYELFSSTRLDTGTYQGTSLDTTDDSTQLPQNYVYYDDDGRPIVIPSGISIETTEFNPN